MPTCEKCGGQIEIRYKNGHKIPIHTSGNCRAQSGGRPYGSTGIIRRRDDVCHPTRCPHCSRAVFFIRHNDGSVWVDELGWPWPKHECFDSTPEPKWREYFREQVPTKPSSKTILGVVVEAKNGIITNSRRTNCMLLAIDAGNEGRHCLAISGANSPEWFRGCIVFVQEDSQRLVTSNHEVRTILNIDVTPEQIGLPDTW